MKIKTIPYKGSKRKLLNTILSVSEEIEFESSSNIEWKVVAFTTYSKHQIEKITSGQRIVFKTELFYKVSESSLYYNDYYDNTPLD